MRTKFYRKRLGFVEDMTKTFGVLFPVHSVVYRPYSTKLKPVTNQ